MSLNSDRNLISNAKKGVDANVARERRAESASKARRDAKSKVIAGLRPKFVHPLKDIHPNFKALGDYNPEDGEYQAAMANLKDIFENPANKTAFPESFKKYFDISFPNLHLNPVLINRLINQFFSESDQENGTRKRNISKLLNDINTFALNVDYIRSDNPDNYATYIENILDMKRELVTKEGETHWAYQQREGKEADPIDDTIRNIKAQFHVDLQNYNLEFHEQISAYKYLNKEITRLETQINEKKQQANPFYEEFFNIGENMEESIEYFKQYFPPGFAEYYLAEYYSNSVNLMQEKWNMWDDFIDLSVALLSDSNRELIMLQNYCASINQYQGLLLKEYLLPAAGAVGAAKFPAAQVGFKKLPRFRNAWELALPEGAGAGTELVTSSVGNQPLFSRGGGMAKQIGGVLEDCDGNIIYPSNPRNQTFKACGLAKSLDELTHDFIGYLGAVELERLIFVYNTYITHVNSELTPGEQAYGLHKFLMKLGENAFSEREWNYYTSVLWYLDNECDDLDKLTIIKMAKVESYPYLTPDVVVDLRGKGYIITLDGTDYLYTKVDNTPIDAEPELGGFTHKIADNATSDAKTYPLVRGVPFGDAANGGARIVTTTTNPLSIVDVKNAAGLMDPKSISGIDMNIMNAPVRNMTDTEIATAATAGNIDIIQQSQNINMADETNGDGTVNIIQYGRTIARNALMGGITTFMGYFKSSLTCTGVKFVISTDGTKFEGVEIATTNTSRSFQLLYGDTTIANISEYHNSKTIKWDVPPTTNPSWLRIWSFARAIFDDLPSALKGKLNADGVSDDEIFTEIVVTLKSFGDSLQVFYKKFWVDWFFNKYPVGFADIPITSTDKNVGGESLLVKSLFWLIGTGIRPHPAYFAKYLQFFGKDSFSAWAMGHAPTAGDRQDGTKTITTTAEVLDDAKKQEKWVYSIRNSLEQLAPDLGDDDAVSYDGAMEDEVEDPTSDVVSLKIQALLETPILNDNGKQVLRTLYNENDDEESLAKLRELALFLEQVLEIVNMTMTPTQATAVTMDTGETESGVGIAQAEPFVPVPTEAENAQIVRKFELLNELLEIKYKTFLNKVVGKLSSPSFNPGAISTYITQVIEHKEFISEKLIAFAKSNMVEGYHSSLTAINKKAAGILTTSAKATSQTLYDIENIKEQELRTSGRQKQSTSRDGAQVVDMLIEEARQKDSKFLVLTENLKQCKQKFKEVCESAEASNRKKKSLLGKIVSATKRTIMGTKQAQAEKAVNAAEKKAATREQKIMDRVYADWKKRKVITADESKSTIISLLTRMGETLSDAVAKMPGLGFGGLGGKKTRRKRNTQKKTNRTKKRRYVTKTAHKKKTKNANRSKKNKTRRKRHY